MRKMEIRDDLMSQNENKSNYFGLRFVPLLIGFFFAIAIDISFRLSGIYAISIAMLIGGATTGYMISGDIKTILINCGTLGFAIGIILAIFNVAQYLLTYLSILPQYQTSDIIYYILGTIVLAAVFGVILGIIGGIFGSQINKKSFRDASIVESANEVPKEDKIKPEETKFEKLVPENKAVNDSATSDALNTDISYHNDEWNFSMNYPASWDIIYENEPAGTWTVPISVGGKIENGLRPHFMVNAHHYQLLEGDNNLTVVHAYDDGNVRESPKTPHEYIEMTKNSIASQFPGIQFISEDATTIEGYPAAKQVYSYEGTNGRRIQEETITIFGDNTTFQLISEIPVDQIEKHQSTMQKILESFKILEK